MPVISSARVGLSLKRALPGAYWDVFLAAPYRFQMLPVLKNGKAHTGLALAAAGQSADKIRDTIGSSLPSATAWVEAVRAAATLDCPSVRRCFGKAQSSAELVTTLACAWQVYQRWCRGDRLPD